MRIPSNITGNYQGGDPSYAGIKPPRTGLSDGNVLAPNFDRVRRFEGMPDMLTGPPLEIGGRYSENTGNRVFIFSKDGDWAEFDIRRAKDHLYGAPALPEEITLNAIEPKTKCSTCESRRYVDQSSDSSVSYQTPTKLNPRMAAMAIGAHEREHLVNQRAEAEREDRIIVRQSITIKYSICPECRIMYPSGGTARTMSVGGKNNEYSQEEKDAPSAGEAGAVGTNV